MSKEEVETPEHLEAWNCPDCGGVTYYWHFDAPDGYGLIARLPSLPDLSAIPAAKQRALAEDLALMQPPELHA